MSTRLKTRASYPFDSSRKPNAPRETLYLIDLENWMQCLPCNASTDENSVADDETQKGAKASYAEPRKSSHL